MKTQKVYGEANATNFVRAQIVRCLGFVTRMNETTMPRKMLDSEGFETRRKGPPRKNGWKMLEKSELENKRMASKV